MSRSSPIKIENVNKKLIIHLLKTKFDVMHQWVYMHNLGTFTHYVSFWFATCFEYVINLEVLSYYYFLTILLPFLQIASGYDLYHLWSKDTHNRYALNSRLFASRSMRKRRILLSEYVTAKNIQLKSNCTRIYSDYLLNYFT